MTTPALPDPFTGLDNHLTAARERAETDALIAWMKPHAEQHNLPALLWRVGVDNTLHGFPYAGQCTEADIATEVLTPWAVALGITPTNTAVVHGITKYHGTVTGREVVLSAITDQAAFEADCRQARDQASEQTN